MKRGLIAAVLALAMGSSLALGSASADPPTASQCPHQNDRIDAANRAQLETSLLCLTNVHRIDSGLAPVFLDTRLAAASRAHSEDMVARHYFDHLTPEGFDSNDRAAAAGYPGGAGENLAYASDGTIRTLFDSLRSSPSHNENMLEPGYRAAGIGLAVGRPPGGQGITGGQLFGFTSANTSETGGVEESADDSRCAEARRALRSKRQAYRKATWATSASTIRSLRSKLRKAKLRVAAVCA